MDIAGNMENLFTGSTYVYCICTYSVADPQHLNVYPDPAFHFDADPDPTFHFDVDPDLTFHFDADPVQSRPIVGTFNCI